MRRWRCRGAGDGGRHTVDSSAEAEPVYSKHTGMSHRLGGNSEPGAGAARSVSAPPPSEHLPFHSDKSPAQYGVGVTRLLP